MSRTHDVTISAFDLDRLEAELRAARDKCHKVRLDRQSAERAYDDVCKQLESWREVAAQLATATAHAGRPYHPSAWHTDQRCAALESYARLKAGATEPYEL